MRILFVFKFSIILIGIVACLSTITAEEKTSYTAPDFTAKTLKGENYSLSRNIGKGPIIISFWATWCGPCILEMKNMKSIYNKYSTKGLQMLLVSTDDNKTQSQIPVITRNYKFPYTILLDPNKNIYNLFHVANVPELFIIDKTGKIIYHHQGYQKGDELKTDEIVASIMAKDK